MHRPVKGFAVLCEALAGLTDDRRLMLLSVGGGRPAIEVAIPHMKLSSIHNDGILSLVYSAADLLVVPSLQENLPLVPLEAMACGIPVVGSDISGIREVVRPGVTGRLVPSKDPAALRGVIAQLLDDPAGRADMSTQGRRLVVEEFSLAMQVRRHVELYTAILSGGPAEAASPEGDAPQGRPMPLADSTPVEVLRC
jgi:glycosyltransferase involved in cell wall biosynthesis